MASSQYSEAYLETGLELISPPANSDLVSFGAPAAGSSLRSIDAFALCLAGAASFEEWGSLPLVATVLLNLTRTIPAC